MRKLLIKTIHSLFVVLIICSILNLTLQIIGVALANINLVNLSRQLFTYLYALAAISGLICVGYSYLKEEK